MVGFANPIAPPVDVWAVRGEGGQREIRGKVTFGYQYEGPPTCVHGGVIAELFDELLGLANIIVGQAGMTGTLKVRYRRPTPLLAPLELVSRFTGRDGRKIFTWGGIYYQGELTAEADGIFIEVLPGQMLGIVSGNANVAEAPLVDRAWRRMMAAGGRGPQPSRAGLPYTLTGSRAVLGSGPAAPIGRRCECPGSGVPSCGSSPGRRSSRCADPRPGSRRERPSPPAMTTTASSERRRGASTGPHCAIRSCRLRRSG